MNTKGFTLVELLAVIVILAIILLIAVPNVMGIIEKAKQDAFCSTAKLAYNAAELFKLQYSGELTEDVEVVFNGTAYASVLDTSTGGDTFNKSFETLEGVERFSQGSLIIGIDGSITVGQTLIAAEGGYQINTLTKQECN